MVFLIYFFTLSPTVGLIDSGELITGCYFLNILHPTGYPLYTLIGNIFSRLPFGSIAQRVNLLSALFSSLAIFFFFLLLKDLTNSTVTATVGSTWFAFSRMVWSVAVIAEVHALTVFFLTVIVCFWTKIDRNNILLLLTFVLGLSFSNHMMILSIFVGTVLFLYLSKISKSKASLKFLCISALFFILGLSVYSYLLIRAQAVPLFNWGNPYNLKRFIWHITGKQYRVWMFSLSGQEVLANLRFGLKLLLQENFYIFIFLPILGFIYLFRTQRNFALCLLIIFLLSFFYAINYSIPDIESYYLPCLFVLTLLFALGLRIIISRVKIPKFFYLVLVFLPLLFNYRRAGMQGNYLAYDAAVNHLQSVPTNAVIITDWWDFYSPALYLQHIERFRTDVCIIDKELLRRSWYFQYLIKQYPWLVKNSSNEINYYLSFLDQFENGRLKDNIGIQDAFIRMINSFIDRNPTRRVFLTFNEQTDYDAKSIKPDWQRVPYGLLYELTNDTIIEEIDYENFLVRKPNLILDLRMKLILKRYEAFGLERAIFLQKIGRRESARRTLDWVLKINPNSKIAQHLIDKIRKELSP